MAKRQIVMWQGGASRGFLAERDFTDAIAFEQMRYESVGAVMLRKRPEELFEWATVSPEGFDTLRWGVAAMLAHHPSEELPASVRAWLVAFLRGELERPKASVGRRSESGLHFVIWATVRHLVDVAGMNPTRNDVSEPTSACDAVAAALADLGREPATFDGVKRVWLSMLRKEGRAIPAT